MRVATVATPPSMPASVIRWRSYKKGSYRWPLTCGGDNVTGTLGKGRIAHPRLLLPQMSQKPDFFALISIQLLKRKSWSGVFVVEPKLMMTTKRSERMDHMITHHRARVPYREPLQNQSLGIENQHRIHKFPLRSKPRTWDKGKDTGH